MLLNKIESTIEKLYELSNEIKRSKIAKNIEDSNILIIDTYDSIAKDLINTSIMTNAQIEFVEPDNSSLLYFHKGNKTILVSHRWLVENQLKDRETNLRIAISFDGNEFKITSSGYCCSIITTAENQLQLFGIISSIWESNRIRMIQSDNIPKAYTSF